MTALDRDEMATRVLSPEAREKLIADRMRRCVYFTGVQYDQCGAGVRYDDVRGSGALPCIDRGDARPCGSCDKRETPTHEAVIASVDLIERRIGLEMEAKIRIRAQSKLTSTLNGHVECPACQQKLAYSIAASNGHIFARCATPGCLAWME